jgi:tRNA(Ile)-lysidine synthase
LHVAGASLRQALERYGHAWVEDLTNQIHRYTRNKIRADILPALEKHFLHSDKPLPAVPRIPHRRKACCKSWRNKILLQVGNPPNIQALQKFSGARQTKCLRHWLVLENMQASAAQMEALLVQVKSCTTRGHDIHIKVGRGFVKREGAVLRC